ncbi:MAG: hypothetical protein ABI861_11250 [Panacibacter sp.]
MANTYYKSRHYLLPSFIVLSFVLCSYNSFAGGDHFKIFLNKKLVSEQFVLLAKSVVNLQLDKANYNDEIAIYYSHCGITGKGRSIKLTDERGNLLKEWKFADNDNDAAMNIRAKEIFNLGKNKTLLKLYYSAKELPGGRMLTTINFSNKNIASNKLIPGYVWSSVSVLFTSLTFIMGKIG